MGQSVVKSVLAVVVFWWLVLAAFGFATADGDFAYQWLSAISMLVLAALGVVLGGLACWFYIWLDKRTKREMLSGEVVRGLRCTIGELPLIALEPVQASDLPDFKNTPDVPPDFFPKWFEKYDKTHPAHTELVRVLLRIFEHKRTLPATHIPGGHGGRTLLEHSLLAAYFMDKLSRTWTYTGLRDKKGNKVILRLRDQAYTFEPDDPMVVLIGLAHDLGKIEAYIFDKDNPQEIIGINHEHDLTGARMLSRLDAAWAIPDHDRQAMIMSIAHYHHPMELPLSPDRRACDDRTIALMELLIKTDFVTSRVEAKGVEPTEKEYDDIGKTAATTELSVEALWKAFSDIISEHGRINSPDPRFNVATLCNCKGFSKPMLLIKESAIRSALVSRLGIGSTPMLGDGRFQLTIDLLKLLDTNGLLVKSFESFTFSAENALWNIDFMSRKAKGATPARKTGWSAVIVIDPKRFPRVEQMEPYWWFASLVRGTMGAARAINKKGKGSNKTDSLDLSDAEFEEQLRLARQEFPGVLNEDAEPVETPSPEDETTDLAAMSEQEPDPAPTSPAPAASAAVTGATGSAPAKPASTGAPVAVAKPQAPAQPAPTAAPVAKPKAPAQQAPTAAPVAVVKPQAPAQPTVPTGEPVAVAKAKEPEPSVQIPAAATSATPKASTANEPEAQEPTKASMEEAFAPLLVEFWAAPMPPGPPAVSVPLKVLTEPTDAEVADTDDSDESTKAIAPVDVMNALKNLVHDAEQRQVVLRQINGRYVVSFQTLTTLAPQLQWKECRYKIEKMTKTSKLKAIFIPEEKGEGYGLAFKIEDF